MFRAVRNNKSEKSHQAKIVNYNAFSEFLQMVPKHNFIGPFKLFFFIGQEKLLKVPSTYKFLLLCGELKIFEGCDKNGLCGEFQK
jgi:hypothetical protein